MSALPLSDDEWIVDNFAGGGGASTSIALALGRSPDVAINHSPEAVARANLGREAIIAEEIVAA